MSWISHYRPHDPIPGQPAFACPFARLARQVLSGNPRVREGIFDPQAAPGARLARATTQDLRVPLPLGLRRATGMISASSPSRWCSATSLSNLRAEWSSPASRRRVPVNPGRRAGDSRSARAEAGAQAGLVGGEASAPRFRYFHPSPGQSAEK